MWADKPMSQFAASPVPLILPSHRPVTELCAPRNDFDLLSQALADAPLLFPPKSGRASDLRQAIAALRRHRRVSVYVSLSEKIGLPLALLLKARRIQTPHVLLAHHLTSAKKRALQARSRWLDGYSRIVVLSEAQAAYLRDEAEYPNQRVALLPDSVDTEFWHLPEIDMSDGERFVLSVGQERRDYHTLFVAARELSSIPFVVVAGSAWTNQNTVREDAPPNVAIRQNLPYVELRDLYARSALVVLPLEASVLYAAGANGLLEGMAMGKTVIVTETPGLSGYAEPDTNACVVPAGAPAALAQAIYGLWKSPEYAARLSVQARPAVATKHSLEAYVAALVGIVRDAEGER